MDLVAAYVQIVGLLADFMSLRRERGSADIAEFTRWLTTHGHNEVVALIERNQATAVSIKAALAEDAKQIIAKLDQLERILASSALAGSPFAALALAVSPAARLSPQQLALLRAYEECGAGKALLMNYLAGAYEFAFLDAPGGYSPSEPRFIETDLDELVAFGLLTQSRNQSGGKVYSITRAGAHVGAHAMTGDSSRHSLTASP